MTLQIVSQVSGPHKVTQYKVARIGLVVSIARFKEGSSFTLKLGKVSVLTVSLTTQPTPQGNSRYLWVSGYKEPKGGVRGLFARRK